MIGSARIAKARLLWLRDGGEWVLVQPGSYSFVNYALGPMLLLCKRKAVFRWVRA